MADMPDDRAFTLTVAADLVEKPDGSMGLKFGLHLEIAPELPPQTINHLPVLLRKAADKAEADIAAGKFRYIDEDEDE